MIALSVVVAIRHKGRVYVGSDSQLTGEDHSIDICALGKTWTHQGVLVGYCGGPVFENELRYSDMIDPLAMSLLQGDDPFADMASIIRKMKDLDETKIEDLQVLFCHGGRIFAIIGSMPFEARDEIAIGSGAAYAKGALRTLKKGGPRQRVKRAIEVACELDTTCGPPVRVEVHPA